MPVAVLCELLEVARSGYYAWRMHKESQRQQENQMLTVAISRIFAESRRTYGSPRVHAKLRQQGHGCNRKRVERLMRQNQWRARPRRGWRPKTTESNHAGPIAPNLLKASTVPKAVNQVWVTDITYLRAAEGWLYLAAVMDLYSRRIIGWSVQETLETRLPLSALEMALATRGKVQGVIHHSDRGCQYASQEYRAALTSHRFVASMSRRGNCFDNAAMESFWSTLKTEALDQSERLPKAAVRQVIVEYIEAIYNRKRIHSSLGYKAPVDFEHQTN